MTVCRVEYAPLGTDSTTGAYRYLPSGELAPAYTRVDTIVDLAGLGSQFGISGAIPVGLNFGVVTRMLGTITGCSGLNIGTEETPTLWGAYVNLASGTITTDADMLAMNVSRYQAPGTVVLQASGGMFTTGLVLVRACGVILS